MGRFAALAQIRPDRMRNYALGRERPGPRVMGRIITASGGMISSDNFSNPAALVNDQTQRVRMAVPDESGLANFLSPPLVSAMEEFGSGAVYSPSKGVFTLGGRSLTPPQLIARANQKRAARGVKPIFYPGALTALPPKREEP